MKVTYGNGFAVAPKAHRIDLIESELTRMTQVDCPVREYFADGLYAREMTIPAGVVVAGAIHKTNHFAVIGKGVLRVLTDDGNRDYRAGEIIRVVAGERNCVCAIEECTWTNFMANPTNERETSKLVEIFTESKASDLIGGSTNKQLTNFSVQLEK